MRWFTSDWHLKHEKCAQLRGFADSATHDEALLAQLRLAVKPDDDLYFLGDLTIRDPALVWAMVDTIPGRKIAVVGNHDNCHPVHANGWNHVREWMDHFEAVTSGATVRLGGERVMLSHLPYLDGGDHTPGEERYRQWRYADEGNYLICGHVHDAWRTRDKMINVGVDMWGMAPVAEITLTKMIQADRERRRQEALTTERNAAA